MTAVTTNECKALEAQVVEAAEAAGLRLPQQYCPVVHHFGPGICIREVFMPAQTFAIGHAQKFEHLNIMLRGAVAILVDGQIKVLRAPLIFVGKPGRKIGYVIEDTIWQNVYATELRDPVAVEEHFVDKSQSFQSFEAEVFELEQAIRAPDRADFAAVLEENGFTADEVRAKTENEADQAPMPEGFGYITVRPSAIEGMGLFLSMRKQAGEVIAPARINGCRTPAGRYTNHSSVPNAIFEKLPNGDIILVAQHNIEGCMGGSKGDEVTVDYRQALAVSRGCDE